MGEVDTKPIESVQAALSLFGQTKNRSTDNDELEQVQELEVLLMDLANVKLQLEAKDSTYKQTLLKQDHYQKIVNELATLLKNSEFKKDMYINKCREALIRIEKLESKVKDITDQLSETEKIGEQISLVMTELNTTQADLLSMEKALSDAREAKLEALTREEMMETELLMEKEKTEELLRHVSELNEAILHSSMAAMEAEKEKCAILLEKEVEIELATTKALEAEEELEFVRKELEAMKSLEKHLMDKSLIIDSLQEELEKANELRSLSDKAASEVVNELNKRKLELEMHRVKMEMEEIRAREKEAQVEIAMLKSELHKGRSRVAAAEAAEARAKHEKSGLYQAVQQLAIEAEEDKKENRMLKEAEKDLKLPLNEESEGKGDDGGDDNNALAMILMEEYKGSVEKEENVYEIENLRKELENAIVKIVELRTRAERATSRAEAAEMAKLALEDQLRKWREQRVKRRAALAALREETFPKEESRSFRHEETPKSYQPLAKILNMKF